MLNIVQLIIAFTLVFTLVPLSSDGVVENPALEWTSIAVAYGLFIGVVGMMVARQIKFHRLAEAAVDRLWLSEDPRAADIQIEARQLSRDRATRLSRAIDVGGLCLFGLLLGVTELCDLVAGLGISDPNLYSFALLGFWVLLLIVQLGADAFLLRHIHQRQVNIGKHVLMQLVFTLVGLVPYALIQILSIMLVLVYPAAEFWSVSYGFSEILKVAVFISIVFWWLPLGLTLFLRTKPIAQTRYGPRIAALLARTKAPVDGVFMIKNSPRGIQSALMIGIAWPFRYVFVTQALADNLNEIEVEAVIAHELGHAKRRHLPQMVGFMLTFILAQTAIGYKGSNQVLGGPPGYGETSGAFDALAIGMVALFLLGFGFLSRRYEREADFFAAKHCGPRSIQSALLSLAQSVGINPRKRGWRHFSIERRVNELNEFHPQAYIPRKSWRREKLMASGAVVLLFGLAASYLWPFFHHDYLTGRGTFEMHLGAAAYERGDYLDGREHYAQAKTHMEYYLTRQDIPDETRRSVEYGVAISEMLAFGTTKNLHRILAEITDPAIRLAILSERDAFLATYENKKPLPPIE